jgi:dolichol-phosphate mannosyltransferase
VVAQLIHRGVAAEADLVVASRYADGGDRDGLAGWYRQLVSRGCTRLSRAAFGRSLRAVSDPMSGFFAVRRAAVDGVELRPHGYKVLLELIVQARPSRVTEVAFHFEQRHAGESKSSAREGLRFLRHLVGLRLRSVGFRGRAVAFAAVGASGIAPNLVTLWVLSHILGMHYLLAAVVASQVAIAWNFTLSDRVVYRYRRRRHWSRRFGHFLLLSNVDLALRIPMLALLVERTEMNYLLANLVTLVLAFGLRFVVADTLIYGRRGECSP